MAENVITKAADVKLDGHALAVYEAAYSAVQDWLAGKSGLRATDPWRVKLQFFRTDLLRKALAVSRVCQFLKGERPRSVLHCDEIIPALWWWRRQVHLHRAIYSYISTVKCKLHMPHPTSMSDLLRESTPLSLSRPVLAELSPQDRMQHSILMCNEEPLSVATLRAKLRNQRDFKKMTRLAEHIADAVEALEEVGLLRKAPEQKRSREESDLVGSDTQEDAEDKPTSNRKRRKPISSRGRLPGWFTKVPCSEHAAQATERRKKLLCPVERFPA